MHVGLGKIAGVDVAGNHHACGDGVLVRHLVEQLSRFRKFLTRKLERHVWGSKTILTIRESTDFWASRLGLRNGFGDSYTLGFGLGVGSFKFEERI
ncbi:pentatricopeptide repeat-containing protein [Pyrus ussuriensis x Pyrus communis]|uniref:Pentatricopeptide repeat-containing protein n=1 Tax=Pyrus ussuriensis x Pyrus communis TaxID=2448454 RepID=A0A5N5GH06_9ROSA|nr:pentatricopeptide repeat-containing protein [Pyrus ussuriensis x Pyrus communis]